MAPESTTEAAESKLHPLENGESEPEIAPPDDPEAPKPDSRASRKRPSAIPEESRGALPFPYAPRSLLKDGTVPEEKFFAYWYKLPQAVQHRQEVYVQRQWPVLDYSKQLSAHQLEEFERLYPLDKRKPRDIDAYLQKCGIKKYLEKYDKVYASKDYREEICRRWGDGDYKFFLNDIGVPGNPNLKRSTICTTIVRIRADVPPVLDINLLSMTDPANAGFIEMRRLRGLPLPGDKQRQEESRAIEEEDMAAGLQQVLDANERLTDKLVEMRKEERPPATAQASTAPDVAAMARVNEQAVNLLADATRAALEASAKANDPQKYVENVFKAAEKIAGDRKGDGAGTEKLFELMLKNQADQHKQILEIQEKAHQRELAALEGRFTLLERMLTEKTAAPVVAGPPSSLADLAKQFREAKKIFSGGDEEAEENVPWWVGLADRFLEAAPKITNDFMENLRRLKEAEIHQVQTQNGQPSQAVATQPKQEDPQVKEDMMLANAIREPLTQAMAEHYKGYQFAGNVIASYGMPAYQKFARDGEMGLTNFLMRTNLHPGLVQRFGAQAVGQFIVEFLDVQKAQETAMEIRQQQGQSAPPPNGAPAPGGPKVNRVPPTQ